MDEPGTASPQYALGQLRRALETAARGADPATRARAAGKVDLWRAVLDGMLSGELAVGSRTPVRDTPAWVTLEVAHGGFATGRYLAEQPPDDVERAVLDRLPALPGSTDRERLNLWYLGDAGQAELLAAAAADRYQVDLPEHAALLAVALLVDRGHPEAALDLVAALRPLLHRLRFTPTLTDRPVPGGATVHLESVGTVAGRLRAARPRPEILAMRDTLGVWSPLADDLAALWADTVTGELPRLGPAGVQGGWPARHFPADWAGRRAAWLDRYAAAVAAGAAPGRHGHPRSNLSRMRRALEACPVDGAALSARDVGWVRRALANTVTRHGPPGGADRVAARAGRTAVLAHPTHDRLAHLVAARLDRYPGHAGIPSVDPLAGPVEPDELPPATAPAGAGPAAGQPGGEPAGGVPAGGVPAGEPIPAAVLARLARAVEAPLPELVERGIVSSAEVLARLLPQVTAQHAAARIRDPAAAGLYARAYAAFRRRRSLLLLDLAAQVRFTELPWAAALDRFRVPDERSVAAAADALRETTLLALTAWPGTILPNPLVRELGTLAARAELALPLVQEVAADIFMGTFTTTWRDAAAVASRTLAGGLYARYYDLPASWPPLPPPPRERRRPWRRQPASRVAADFAALCATRAEEAGAGGGRGSVAANGAVLEQSQILTTHNLAVLAVGLGVADELRARAPELAARALDLAVGTVARLPAERRLALPAVKNAAYAWRQGIFFLGWCEPAELAVRLRRLAEATATGPAAALQPAGAGLAHVASGGRFGPDGTTAGGPGRRLLGWSVGGHWLLPDGAA